MLKEEWLVSIDGKPCMTCESEKYAIELAISCKGTYTSIPCITAEGDDKGAAKGYDALDAQVLEGEYERV